ncbi:uncharacterized protein C8D76_10473 [Pasteurella langaaensis DSM 22999]|uniref:TPM domain-containing protein n=1 Tax=Alitibacter langaaensis DSM 22999 TaxID=1122935 RepID=A0A2U0T8D9_9PAST|nr:YgcG family protein [Pasteurella langaaensis]PVX39871.1 uncharacterized protein C8D76_10473 [Pasteurella langaaensis DSM 22999]
MVKWLKSAVVLFTVFMSSVTFADDFPPVPSPFRYVNDYTHTLSSQEVQYLENKLRQYSSETSSQIAVVMLGSVGQYDISDYAFQLGDKWGIGRKKLDNGVLLLVAKDNRKVFIATGRGLEGALPDALLSQIIRKVILPNFRSGNYAQGINQALDNIIAASQNEYAALPTDANETAIDDYIPFIIICLFILFVLFGELSWRRSAYVSPTKNHDQLQNAAIIASMIANSRRNRYGGGGFGGGFGGGDSGGFGGGGFGGGGAGGSW